MWRTQTTTPTRTGQTQAQSGFFLTEPLTLNSCRSLVYASGNESIIYFTDLFKPIKTYVYARKKHPFANYPAAKHPNAANLRLQTYDKKTVVFFIKTARSSTLALAIIFQIKVFFTKVSVPVKKYNCLNILVVSLELSDYW